MTLHRAVPSLLLLAMSALGGCPGPEPIDPVLLERDRALDEVKKLRAEVGRLRTRLADCEKQVAALQDLGDKRPGKLFYVQRVEIGSYTGGVDLDGQDGHDGIKVFLQPIDQHGSPIKAAGEATVQLYDLAAPKEDNLIAEHRLTADELAKKWSSGFLVYHYSFVCRWKPHPPKHRDVTVRVAFLDYLTGKTFTAQTVCSVDLPPAAKP
jgi:hypothetical protein